MSYYEIIKNRILFLRNDTLGMFAMFISIFLTLLIGWYMPDRIPLSVAKEIFGIIITVLSNLTSVFVALLVAVTLFQKTNYDKYFIKSKLLSPGIASILTLVSTSTGYVLAVIIDDTLPRLYVLIHILGFCYSNISIMYLIYGVAFSTSYFMQGEVKHTEVKRSKDN